MKRTKGEQTVPNEYTREEIIKKVKHYFEADGFSCQEYSESLGAVRLPLYCSKRVEDGTELEIVVDIITESKVSKSLYLPTITVEGATIENACPPRFFQYYLPHIRIFWAYGHYVIKNGDYDEFKAACKKNGIGLLEVSDSSVIMVQDAKSLRETVGEHVMNEVETAVGGHPRVELLFNRLSNLVAAQQEDYIHYLVRYAAPQFQLREITRRGTDYLSLILMNKLQEVTNLEYGEDLRRLAIDYRRAAKGDYQIALDTIKSLWSSRLHTEYPEIQRNFEVVLLLTPEYREHFLHQFQVFLLGALIIDKLHDTSAIQAFEHSNGSTIEDAWLAASTYHDFNYPVERCEKWMTDFFQQNLHIIDDNELFTLKLEKVVVTDEFLSKMQNLCAAIGCSFDDRMLRFILERSALQRDHAVLGALTFMKKFQNNTQLSTQAVSHAALSILLHDPNNWKCFCGEVSVPNAPDWEVDFSNKRLLPRLTLDSFPLEFLLAYCDEAQEWGRVGRDYEITKPQLEDIQVNQSEVLTHISVEDDTSYNKKRGKIQQLKRYLQDERFKIKIESRIGGSTEVFRMTGA